MTTLVKITDDIKYGISQQQLTLMSLLDFENAFNNVDYDILVALLFSLNISPTVIVLLSWFHF